MSDPTPARPTHSEVDLVELRVGVSGLTAEVQRMRADLSVLATLPTQLTAVAELHAERLSNLAETHRRDVVELHADIAAEAGRRRSAIESVERKVDEVETRLDRKVGAVQEWQTWAIRIVVGAVLLAIVGAVLVTP